MISATRKFAKSPVAWLLFGLLILSFLIFGIGDVFNAQLSQNVVDAGSRRVRPAEFQQDFDRALKTLSEEQRRPISRDEAIQGRFHEQLLESVAMREGLAAATEKLGLKASPKLVAQELEGIPAFFSQLTGKFDKSAYADTLARAGYTVAKFEQGIKDDTATRALMTGITAGAAPPKTYGALVALNQSETRSLDYVVLDPRKAAAPPAPTEQQLTAFMNEPNVSSRIRKAETRDLTVVRFSTREAAQSVKVDPAELKKLYDFRLPTLSEPELRSFIQIPAKDAAAAKAAADRLTRGEDPTAIAKALGVTPVVYDQKPKTSTSDPKVADAAFAMREGEVRSVQGSLGFAALKVTKVTPGRTPTLEDVRAQLELDLRKENAQKQVFDAAEKFQDALEAGGDLAAAAKAAGVTPITLAAVTRDEGLPPQQTGRAPRPGLSPKLVEKAFSLSQGSESDVEDEGNSEYYVVRVNKITPAAMPALAEVRDMVTNAWLAREVDKQIAKQAEDLAARVRKGESVQAAAQAMGLQAVKAEGVTFQTQKELGATLGQNGLAGLFRTKPGEVFVAQAGMPGSQVVGKVLTVTAAPPAEAAKVVDQMRGALSQAFSEDFRQMTAEAARRIVKVQVDKDLAYGALGIDPPAQEDEKAKAAPAKKDKAG